MKKTILLLATFLIGTHLSGLAAAGDLVTKYSVEGDFEEVKEMLTMAITDQGLKVSGVLHISDMLDRTQEAVRGGMKIYAKAESIEFCSAKISHLMVQADPLNITICPFTIAIFSLADAPEQLYLAFRNPKLMGDDHEAEQQVFKFLDGIAREAAGL